MTTRPGRFLLAVILAAAGCGVFTEPLPRHVALLAEDPPVVTIPDTVSAGMEFEVSFTTLYLGYCQRPGPTEVEIADLVARITPFTLSLTPKGRACPDGAREFRRAAKVKFDRPGLARVLLRVLTNSDSATTLEFDVVVRATNT